MQSLVLVGIAGAAGAVSRYAVGLLAARSLGDHFAFGTLLVNISANLVLGLGAVWLGFMSARLALPTG